MTASRPRLIFGEVHRSGHRYVYLFDGNGKTKAGVHCLVLEAFEGERPPGMFACHRDGDPSNNHIGNLRWATPRENMIDMVGHKNHPGQKLDNDRVRLIWARLVAGDSARSVAKEFGVSSTTITSIKMGTTWKHLTATLPGEPRQGQADSLPDEEWRPLPGYQGYEVSSRGRLRSLRRKNPRLIEPRLINQKPYFLVWQHDRYRTISAPRAMRIAFEGPVEGWKPRGPKPKER